MFRILTLLLLVFPLMMACGDAAPKENNGANNGNNGSNNGNNGGNNGSNNGGGTNIDPNDFDRDCTYDDECALVHGGDVCHCFESGCQSSIRQDQVAGYQAAIDAIDCTGVEPLPCAEDACQAQTAICKAGLCEAVVMPQVWARDFDQSCEMADQCASVQEGLVCQTCDCPNAAVNTEAQETFNNAVNSATSETGCNPPELDCACARPNLDCVEGSCAIVD